MNTKIFVGIGVGIIVIAVVVFVIKPPGSSVTPPAGPLPQIPAGISQEEHESHHTNLPQ